jgi:hypothetical protein
MKKIFYEKVGRRYNPVHEYDSDLVNALPKGSHLLIVYPGGSSTRYNITPAYAPLIAASRVAEDTISDAIRKASELHPRNTPITEGQQRAWKKLAKEFGDELPTLQINSARDIAQAGVNALQEEANKLMKHESVRQAYEHFLLVCELTKEHNER